MLPLGILNASTKNVRMTANRTTDTAKIFVHSQMKSQPDRRRLSSRRASIRCSGVIERGELSLVCCSGSGIGIPIGSLIYCDLAAGPVGSNRRVPPITEIGRSEQVLIGILPHYGTGQSGVPR